ncbi:MAG: hypothetical protein QOE73_1765 [Verrucomicrobiota bacterium]
MTGKAISLSVILQSSIWAAACCLYLALGVPKIVSAFKVPAPAPLTAYHSTDAYLLACTRVKAVSAGLIKFFKTLPSNKSVVVFIPEDDVCGDVIGMTISYLAWPRAVRTIAVGLPNIAPALQKIDRASLGAVIFYVVKPPSSWKGFDVRLGPNLTVVSLSPENKAD